MTKVVLIVGLALTVLGVNGSAAEAPKAVDACALLKAAEIQALAGVGKIGAGKASTDALGSSICRYEWGTGANVQGGRSTLDISVTLISKAFPGTKVSVLREGMIAKANAGAPNEGVIAAVGDVATYESNAPIRMNATALVKGNLLVVAFQSRDARVKKDQVIALLKAAAGR